MARTPSGRLLRSLPVVLSILLAGCCGGGSKSTTTNKPPTPLVITLTTPLPSGVVNIAYSATLTASGGTAPYSWSITGGALPSGLALGAGGVLAGTPTAVGSSTFTIQVADSESTPQTTTVSVALAIGDGAVAITTASPLPLGKLNAAYSATLAASGGTPPYSWSVTSGSLPAGLALSAAGVVSGTPTAYGTSNITVQATDSAATPQSASAAFVLQVSGGPLAIATASLPSGTQGTGYSATVSAVGGVPPYTWSVDPGVPAGLALSSVGVLAGTPTGVSSTSPIFTAVDSVGAAASQVLPLLISPALGSIPDGRYAFNFAGTTPQGTPLAPNAIAINGSFVVQGGKVQSGYYDANTNAGPALIEQKISGGALVAYADGLGTLTLQAGGGALTFSLAIPASVASGGAAPIRIIEFDDADGTGTRGSGVLKAASPQPTAAAISGNFAFLFSGTDSQQNEQALVGSFQTNGVANPDGSYQIDGGSADANQFGGVLASWNPVGGYYSVDANGHGELAIQLGNAPGHFHYSFYQVSPTEWLVISIDPATLNSPLVSGSVLRQTGAPFSVASLPAQSVLQISGVQPTSGGGTEPAVTLGLASSDGSGKVAYSFDQFAGALTTGGSLAVTYAVDAATGRAATTGATAAPILYIIDGNSAFYLGSDRSASSGVIEAQTGSPFTNASFAGSYLGGSLPLANTAALNENGIVAADGDGNLLFTTNRSSDLGLTLYDNVAGTYSVDGTGRVVVTAPDGLTRIFYVVSPSKVAYLTGDGGGYLGSFEQ